MSTVTARGGVFEPDSPREVVVIPAVNVAHSGRDYHPYDIAPDGQRFLILQFVLAPNTVTSQIGPDTYSGLTVAVNWTGALKK